MKFFGILLSLGSFMVLDVDASGDENSWNYGGENKDFFYIQQCLALCQKNKTESPCKLKPTLSK